MERGEMGVLTPYLCVADARSAIEWYVGRLDARVTMAPVVMDDGRVGHVELTLPGGGRLLMADEFPEAGVAVPDPEWGAPVVLHLDVEDVVGVVGRVRAGGAVIDREPEVTGYGVIAGFVDPFGHRWLLTEAPDGPSATEGA